MQQKEFRNILLAVSLTQLTDKIVPTAIYIAGKFDAALHLLFVVRLSRDDLFNTPGEVSKIKDELVEKAKQKLEEYADANFKNIAVKKKIIGVGDPADEIIAYIEKEDIDFAIMGTHGRRGLKKTFLGSVASEVIKRSPVPVTIINPMRIK